MDIQPLTRGVRRQVYTLAYEAFATNQFIRLFDGPEHHLRPAYSAEARSSGLLKILGGMISHSICQDGVGFPYLSPTCFWYIVGGEEKAISCSKIIMFPQCVFSTYELFSSALDSLIVGRRPSDMATTTSSPMHNHKVANINIFPTLIRSNT